MNDTNDKEEQNDASRRHGPLEPGHRDHQWQEPAPGLSALEALRKKDGLASESLADMNTRRAPRTIADESLSDMKVRNAPRPLSEEQAGYLRRWQELLSRSKDPEQRWTVDENRELWELTRLLLGIFSERLEELEKTRKLPRGAAELLRFTQSGIEDSLHGSLPPAWHPRNLPDQYRRKGNSYDDKRKKAIRYAVAYAACVEDKVIVDEHSTQFLMETYRRTRAAVCGWTRKASAEDRRGEEYHDLKRRADVVNEQRRDARSKRLEVVRREVQKASLGYRKPER